MTGMDWAVIIGGLAAIGWINWYFFLATGTVRVRMPQRDARGETGRSGAQRRPT